MAKRRHVMTPARQRALKKAQREAALRRKHGAKYAPLKSGRRKTISRNRKILRAAAMAYNGVQIAAGAAMIGYTVHDTYQTRKMMQNTRKMVHKQPTQRISSRHGKGRTSGPPRSSSAYAIHARRHRGAKPVW